MTKSMSPGSGYVAFLVRCIAPGGTIQTTTSRVSYPPKNTDYDRRSTARYIAVEAAPDLLGSTTYLQFVEGIIEVTLPDGTTFRFLMRPKFDTLVDEIGREHFGFEWRATHVADDFYIILPNEE